MTHSRVFLGEILILSLLRNSPYFMESKGLLLHSHESTNFSYPTPNESSPHQLISLRYI